MLTPRQRQVAVAGLLIGLAVGLCLSVLVISMLSNRMFIVGVNWSVPGLYVGPCILLGMFVAGVWLLRSRKYK